MSNHSDHKVLLFLAAVAVLGTGMRLARSTRGDHADPAQPALDHQQFVAAQAAQGGSGRGRHTHMKVPADSADTTRHTARDSARRHPREAPPLDRPGYVGGRLDLDVASAAQLDSLPGITPALARRIVADRIVRGPFLRLDGLLRVFGVNARVLRQLDTLVTFSGTYRFPDRTDTVIPPKKKKKRKSARAADG